MPFTPYFAKNLLDWITGAAAATQPGARWIAFATGSPATDGASDGPGLSRVTWNAAAANSPQQSATNRSAGTCTFTAAGTVRGWNLYDASTANATRLAYGTFSSTIGCASGDAPAIAAGALKITLK